MNWWSSFSFTLSDTKSQSGILFLLSYGGFNQILYSKNLLWKKNKCGYFISSFFQQRLPVVFFLVKEQKKKSLGRRKSRESLCSLTYLHSKFHHSPRYSFVWFSFTWPHSKIFHTKITSLEGMILRSPVLYVTNSKCSVNSDDWQKEEGAKRSTAVLQHCQSLSQIQRQKCFRKTL